MLDTKIGHMQLPNSIKFVTEREQHHWTEIQNAKGAHRVKLWIQTTFFGDQAFDDSSA